MRISKKWTAILMCLLLALGQAVGAMAEDAKAVPTLQSAAEAGRELNSSIKLEWHNLPLLDEETNKMVSALLGAVEFTDRSAVKGENMEEMYSSFGMKLSGQDAITFDMAIEGDALYLSSQLFGQPVKIAADDVEQFLSNFGAYLDKIAAEQGEDMPPDTFKDMMATMYASAMESAKQHPADMKEMKDADPMEVVRQMYATYGLEDALNIGEAWANDHMKGEDYEGPFSSVYDIEIASAKKYQITKEELISLMSDVMKTFEGNEAFWTYVMNTSNNMVEPDQQFSLEEIMSEVPEMTQEMIAAMDQIPDDILIRYLECYDAAGENIIGQIEFVVPGTEGGEGEFVLYMEWVNGINQMYLETIMGSDGFVMEVVPKEELPGGVKDNGFIAQLSIIAGDELVAEIYADASSVKAESESGSVWDGSLLLAVQAEGTQMGVEFVVNQTDTYQGEDITSEAMIDVNVAMGETTMPLLTIDAVCASGEPQGPGVDVTADDATFITPGTMTEEEFAAWVETVSVSAMQAGLGILSLLPSEVVMSVMSGMN